MFEKTRKKSIIRFFSEKNVNFWWNCMSNVRKSLKFAPPWQKQRKKYQNDIWLSIAHCHFQYIVDFFRCSIPEETSSISPLAPPITIFVILKAMPIDFRCQNLNFCSIFQIHTRISFICIQHLFKSNYKRNIIPKKFLNINSCENRFRCLWIYTVL